MTGGDAECLRNWVGTPEDKPFLKPHFVYETALGPHSTAWNTQESQSLSPSHTARCLPCGRPVRVRRGGLGGRGDAGRGAEVSAVRDTGSKAPAGREAAVTPRGWPARQQSQVSPPRSRPHRGLRSWGDAPAGPSRLPRGGSDAPAARPIPTPPPTIRSRGDAPACRAPPPREWGDTPSPWGWG